jgi:hypothetical protein
VSQEIGVWFDKPNQRQKISYFKDTDYSIWDLNNASSKKFYGVVTYKPKDKESEQLCTLKGTIGLNQSELLVIFPDLSN